MTALLTAGARLGRHRIVSPLGVGGLGSVYRAYDTERSRYLALKVLHDLGEGSLERIRAEFRSLELERHPNVVTFYEFGRHGETPFYTMRLVEGAPFLGASSLTVTARAGVTAESTGEVAAPNDLARWMLQLTEALEWIHERGLLHLDVKPSNLLIDRKGDLVLADFGLATRLESGSARGAAPAEWTPGYGSPEHRARESVTTASDWYGVGATLFRALVGRAPRGEEDRGLARREGALGELCLRLLDPEPEKRPGAAAIRALLDAAPRAGAPLAREVRCVGREGELDDVRRALESAGRRHAVFLVLGERGAGKTVFLRELAAQLARTESPHAAVSLVRARDWEAVPFGTFGELLAGVGAGDWRTDRARTLEELAASAARALDAAAAPRPVTLCLDDFQLCDPDSGRLLAALLSRPATRPLRVVLVANQSERATEVVAAFERWLLALPAGVRYERRTLAPWSGRSSERDDWTPPALETLSPEAREYLVLAALAESRPTQGVLRRAFGEDRDDVDALAELRSLRCLSTTGSSLSDRVEVTDRAREKARAALAPEKARALHVQLARAMGNESQFLAARARHLGLAGLRGAAAAQAILAGDSARAQLAFHRAAELYRAALEWGAPSSDERVRLLRASAELFAASGRGTDAAEAWSAAASASEPSSAKGLRLAAAEQLLTSGRFDEGRAALRASAREHRVAYPGSVASAVTRTALGLLRVGRVTRPGANAGESPDALARCRMATTGFRGLMPIDPARAAYFALEAFRWSARSGSRSHYADAGVSLASGVLAPAGGRLGRRAEEIVAEAEEIAAELGDSALAARAGLARSTMAFWKGEWHTAHAHASHAAETLTRLGVSGGFERNILNLVVTRSLEELGRWDDAARASAEMYLDALDRSDRYALVTASLNFGMISVARGDPEAAHAWARRALDGWPGKGMQVQHVYALRVDAYADLLAGDAESAWRRVDEAWSAIRSGMHLRIPAGRVDLELLRARIQLARAESRVSRAELVAAARRSLRNLGRLQARPDVAAHVAALEACAQRLEGHAGAESLERAARAYRESRLDALADACELALAATPEAAETATARLAAAGVSDAMRFSQVFVPSFGITRGEKPR